MPQRSLGAFRLLRGLATALVLLAFVTAPESGLAQSPSFNVRIYPFDVWGPRAGWGFGAGVVAHDLVRPGSETLLTVAPAAHESVATLSMASASPYVARTYVLVDALAETTERQWFYGLGPRSADDSKVALNMNRWWARLRVGQRLGAAPVYVQPHATLMQHDVDGVSNVTDRALSQMSLVSVRSIPGVRHPRLDPAPTEGRELDSRQLGLRAGLDIIYDTRDRAFGATRGLLVQATAARYEELRAQDLRYDRLDVRTYGFLPLGDRYRLALGLRTTLTANRGDTPLPFYLLPKLDGHTVPGWARNRFYGSDLVSAHVLSWFPILRVLDLFALEGHLGVHAASVYDDLGDQFALSLSFDETINDGSTVPLRPAASTGVRIGPLFRDETYVDVAVGISPEGVTGVRFSFVQSLRLRRPPHHHSAE